MAMVEIFNLFFLLASAIALLKYSSGDLKQVYFLKLPLLFADGAN
jgi:hypothetical protein